MLLTPMEGEATYTRETQDLSTVVTAVATLESVKALLPFVPRLLSSQLAAVVPEHPSLTGLASLDESYTMGALSKERFAKIPTSFFIHYKSLTFLCHYLLWTAVFIRVADRFHCSSRDKRSKYTHLYTSSQV